DSFNNTKTDYTGTVHFAVGTADGAATLPSNYDLTTTRVNDNHVQTSTTATTLTVAQSNTIVVNDTVSTGSTGTSNSFTVNPGAINNFTLKDGSCSNIDPQTPRTFPTRRSSDLDSFNNTKTDYTGTVHFAVGTADGAATLPSN